MLEIKKDSKIEYFSMINRDIPRSKIKMLNGSTKIVNLQECMDLFQLDY